jgi:hypothetical protein
MKGRELLFYVLHFGGDDEALFFIIVLRDYVPIWKIFLCTLPQWEKTYYNN